MTERTLRSERKRELRQARRTPPSERRLRRRCFWTWPFGHASEILPETDVLIVQRCVGCGRTVYR